MSHDIVHSNCMPEAEFNLIPDARQGTMEACEKYRNFYTSIIIIIIIIIIVALQCRSTTRVMVR